MPTYEYECQKCKKHFDAFQSITAPHLKTCPKCNGKVKRLISSGAGIIFKGSGFYATDYKMKPERDKKKAEEAKAACPAAKECKGCKKSKK